MNWPDIVLAFTNDHLLDLARERGIAPAMFFHLRRLGLLGWFKGGPAFPIANSAGEVIGFHSRLRLAEGQRQTWHYDWFGNQRDVRPLVLGNLEAAVEVWVFESPWDAIAALATQGWHLTPINDQQIAAVITRGALNGVKIRGLIPAGKRILAFPQNDPVKNPGKPTPAQKWLGDIVEHAGSPVRVVQTPPQFKDLNDWVKAGAKLPDLHAAISAAQPASVTHTPSIELIDSDDQGEEVDEVDEPFPTDALPSPYSDMVREVARVLQVPEAIPGMTMLPAISTAIGPALRTELIPGRITRGNIFVLGVGRSGTGKSLGADPILAPLYDLDSARLEQWKREARPGLEARRKLLAAEIERITKSVKRSAGEVQRATLESELAGKQAALQQVDDSLIEPHLMCEDITSQKLAMLMKQNGEATSIITTDGGDLVNNLLGRYSKLDRTDDALVVKGFSGDPCMVDRMGRDSIRLKHPWLSMLLWVQPEKRDTLFGSRQLRDGGLLPRCLIAEIDADLNHIEETAADITTKTRLAYTQQISTLLQTFRLGQQTHLINATAEARQIVRTYANEIIDQRNAAASSRLDSFRARWAEQACRLSVVLHAAKWGPEAAKQVLDAETAQAGVTLARWFGEQQMRLLGEGEADEREQVLTGLRNLARQKPNGFTARDVYRARICDTAKEAERCLEAFVAKGLLSGDKVKTPGRPKFVYCFAGGAA